MKFRSCSKNEFFFTTKTLNPLNIVNKKIGGLFYKSTNLLKIIQLNGKH